MPAINLHRLEGRLFIENSRLCMVIGVDPESGMGRVSSRVNDERLIRDMPLTEICNRLSTSAKLDNVRGPEAMNRVFCDDSATTDEDETEQWYFNTREGRQGPFECEHSAGQALNQYIITSQNTEALETVSL